jgi:hypothetical protein
VSGDDDDRTATLEDAARIELVQLWSDLEDARRTAINTTWSIRCENVAYRIVELSRHVGATPWEQISVRLLRDGVYERVLRDAGITYPPIDWDRVALTEARIAERLRSVRES